MKLSIGKGDKVQMITGNQKGQQGAVLALDKKKMQIKVQNINMQTHFDKEEGKLQKEGFVSYSNVKLVEKVVKTKKKKKKAAAKSK